MRFNFFPIVQHAFYKLKRVLLKSMVKNLPAGAQKRVKALKNLQLEFLKHEWYGNTF